MKQILIQLMLAGPAFIEALIIDPLLWKKDKSDKPTSTYIRAGITIAIGIIVQFWIKDNWALLAMLGVVVWYVAIFNYLVNWKLGKPYHYKQNWWIFGMWQIKIIVLLSFIIIYLTFNSTIDPQASLPFNLPRFR